jgi:hypothetical protein
MVHYFFVFDVYVPRVRIRGISRYFFYHLHSVWCTFHFQKPTLVGLYLLIDLDVMIAEEYSMHFF